MLLASANFPGKWGESPSNSRAAPHLWAQVREQGHVEQLPQLGALGSGSQRVCTCLDLHEGRDVTWRGSVLPSRGEGAWKEAGPQRWLAVCLA